MTAAAVDPAKDESAVHTEVRGRVLVITLNRPEAPRGTERPLAIAASKQVLRSAPGRPEEELWQLQRPLIKTVFRSDDAREGSRAFAQKRAPQWTAT
jgi:enoyl-CoA hydratase/carnithine racemase